jgi:CHAD domain-containing protein
MAGLRKFPTNSAQADYFKELFQTRSTQFKKDLRLAQKNLSADSVHDLRVAIRRLLSLYQTLLILDDSAEMNAAVKQLKRLLQPLGQYRDLLLQSERLKREAKKSADGIKKYRAYLQYQIGKNKPKVSKILVDFELDKFNGKHNIRFPKYPSQQDIDWYRIIQQAVEKIMQLEKNVFKKLAIEDFHKMRIRIKRLRYLLEILLGLVPRIRKSHVKSLVRLQSLMGDIHDMDLLAMDLLKFSQSLYPDKAGYIAVAEYVEKLREKRQAAFVQFHKEFEKFLKGEFDL